jgi:uncharacterized protein involved in exopolysaccharide biosynthesis
MSEDFISKKTNITNPTIVDVYIAIRQNRILILTTMLITMISAISLAFLLPTTYRSEVVLSPSKTLDDQPRPGGALSALSALRVLPGSQTDGSAEALAILESRRFSAQFIQKHNLLSELVPERDARTAAEDEKSATALELEDAVLRFDRDVRSVAVDDETGFIRLYVDWRSPVLAQRWANALVDDLNSEMRERAIVEARADLDYLQERLRESQLPEIRASLANLVQNRMERIMLAENRPNYAFKVIDPATRSKYRYQPRRTLLIAGGFVVGLILSLALVVIVTTLRHLRATV